jgi:predicted GTPase
MLTDEFQFPLVNILLFGSVGAGKSSVFNTINSIFRGKIFNVARSGNAEHSLTTKV